MHLSEFKFLTDENIPPRAVAWLKTFFLLILMQRFLLFWWEMRSRMFLKFGYVCFESAPSVKSNKKPSPTSDVMEGFFIPSVYLQKNA